MTEDFLAWVKVKAQNITADEMLDDHAFTVRLLNDVLWGRSKKFNRSKETGQSQGLELLRREYDMEVFEMGLLICKVPKCGGSLIVMKDREGKVTYRCPRCGKVYEERPK